MSNTTNNIFKRIVAAFLLLATLAGTTTLLEKKVEAACSHSNYSIVTIVSQSTCTRKGTAYCKCKSCGWTFYVSLPKSASHSSVTKTTVAQATCTTNGSRYCKCSTCGATWYETIVATGHKPCVKDYKGYARLYCKNCDKRFFPSSFPKGLNDFAGYIYGKSFSSLSDSQKQNVKVNWISYTISKTKTDAKDYIKDYKSDLQIKVENADKLFKFVGKCNNIAKLYGFEEAGVVAGILGKATFVTCLLNPSKTTGDKVLAAVSLISPTAGQILNSYKTLCEGLIALSLSGISYTIGTEMGAYCDDYGISFEPPTSPTGTPTKTPTYEELFTADKNGRTNLDRFVNYMLNGDSYGEFRGFKYLCDHKKTNQVYYNFVILWLVRPALEKEFSGSTEYKTILSLLKAAK